MLQGALVRFELGVHAVREVLTHDYARLVAWYDYEFLISHYALPFVHMQYAALIDFYALSFVHCGVWLFFASYPLVHFCVLGEFVEPLFVFLCLLLCA